MIAALERAIAAHPGSRGRASLLHPPDRGVAHARARGGERRSAGRADAGGRTHGPHARAHLPPRRSVRRRGRGQRARDRGRRGLPGAVPGAGAVSGQLLPAQPALPVGGGDARRPQRGRRSTPRGRSRRRCRITTPARWPGRRTFRSRRGSPTCDSAAGSEMLTEPSAAGDRAVRHGHLALRARPGVRRARPDRRAPRRSWPRSRRVMAHEAFRDDAQGPAAADQPADRERASCAASWLRARGRHDEAVRLLREAVGASRTPSRTTSRRSGISRRGRCSARCCSRPDAPAEAEAVYREDLRAVPRERLVAVRTVAEPRRAGRGRRRRGRCAHASTRRGRAPTSRSTSSRVLRPIGQCTPSSHVANTNGGIHEEVRVAVNGRHAAVCRAGQRRPACR